MYLCSSLSSYRATDIITADVLLPDVVIYTLLMDMRAHAFDYIRIQRLSSTSARRPRTFSLALAGKRLHLQNVVVWTLHRPLPGVNCANLSRTQTSRRQPPHACLRAGNRSLRSRTSSFVIVSHPFTIGNGARNPVNFMNMN